MHSDGNYILYKHNKHGASSCFSSSSTTSCSSCSIQRKFEVSVRRCDGGMQASWHRQSSASSRCCLVAASPWRREQTTEDAEYVRKENRTLCLCVCCQMPSELLSLAITWRRIPLKATAFVVFGGSVRLVISSRTQRHSMTPVESLSVAAPGGL